MKTATTSVITCVYRNETTKMQIIRINEGTDFYLERMVMPGQGLMFEAPTSASLQIHSNCMMAAILEDTIPCQQLQRNSETSVVALHPQPVAAW